MKQHPIPQDITGYRFHLIGSMTLRQFSELAVGALFAFIIYKSNLIFVVKWPLFILTIIIAIMIAFVPIEERPLDFWIVTFFKNLWKPTKFFWKRTSKIPEFFHYKTDENRDVDRTPDVDYSPVRKERIQEFLKSMPKEDESLDEWDIHHNQRAHQLLASFDQVEVKKENISINPQTLKSKPMLKTRIRKLKALNQVEEAQKSDGWKQSHIVEKNAAGKESRAAIEVIEKENLGDHQQTNDAKPQAQSPPPPPRPNLKSSLNNDIEALKKQEALQANQLFGTVFDAEDHPVANALIEVYESQDEQALRIIKTQADGSFFIKTALPNGEYLIKTEAENLNFATLSIKLTGKVLPAIQIVAKTA
jgi:hypothetical protein